jgi:putative phage-type endonuclease
MILDDHCEIVLVRDGTNDFEWLEARRNGISGSDALAAMGADPRKQRTALWIEKTQGRATEENEAMVMGRILEPAVKRGFEWKSGLEVIDSDALYRSIAWPWMLATPDGFVRKPSGELGLFEAKTTTVHLEDDWVDGNVPARAAAQTMHYLAVTGLPFAFVAVLIDNKVQYRYFERDEELIATIVAAEEEFWGYVVRGEMPPIEFNPDRGDVIDLMWPTHADGKTLELDSAGEKALAAYRQANEQYRHWEQRRKELGEEIRLLATDAEVLNVEGQQAATLRSNLVNRIDTEKLRTTYPAIAAECTVTSTQRALRLTKPKKEKP